MTTGRITLLLDRFPALSATQVPGQRFPALETLLGRGKPSNHGYLNSDELRFASFGLATGNSLPIGALTRMADGAGNHDVRSYCLRLDPVTLWADLARVIMARCGFADFDDQERKEIENTVRSVLLQEGFDLHSDHPERWTIALEKPLPFSFTPLEDALGMDLADVLPDHPEALYWRRVLNEIQMALHACPVNIRRRQHGRAEVNSVWFWGGGPVPSPAPRKSFQTVYADHPVSRGLAMLHDCVLHDLGAAENNDFAHDGEDILLDWSLPPASSAGQLEQLEHITGRLLDRVKFDGSPVQVRVGGGAGWLFDRSCRRRWWKRIVPLENYLEVR